MDYCSEHMMAYPSCRRTFRAGDHVSFDRHYRIKHLPLVCPGHQLALNVDGTGEYPGYFDGRYAEPKFGLVVPIDHDVLLLSREFQKLDSALRSSSFASDVNWQLCSERSGKVHATLMNDMTKESIEQIVADAPSFFHRQGPIGIRVGGPFMGQINTGRVYFPLYPSIVNGEDVFATLQTMMGCKPTRLYVAGYYHFANELPPMQTAELGKIVNTWKSKIILEQKLKTLEIWRTNDDLALSAGLIHQISLPD